MGFVEESWGRKARASWWAATASSMMVIACPLWVFWNWAGLEYFDGSYLAEIESLKHHGLKIFLERYLPRPSGEAARGCFAWLLFQAALYQWLPGPLSQGQMTPAGHKLEYKTNGLLAWLVTHIIAAALVSLDVVKATVIADHWEGIVVAINVYGIVLSFLCLVKGYLAPSYAGDCKYSGSFIADYFIGVELNPRFGENFDIKLFHNGRPGIVAWTLIDLSFAAAQYRDFGYISNSMMIAVLLHTIYVLDLFVNEDWYLRTLDICHDHYGFYLGWGSMAALPTIYTMQCQYLARHPKNLSLLWVTMTLALGLGGYAIFRSANHQKDIIRKSNGQCKIWGKTPEYMRFSYKTEDGKEHESIILCSGWWGFARHSNYLGDLMQATSLGLACHSRSFLPWCYTLLLASIFFNRLQRDEARCQRKYGKAWGEYRKKVPWRLLPGVY